MDNSKYSDQGGFICDSSRIMSEDAIGFIEVVPNIWDA